MGIAIILTLAIFLLGFVTSLSVRIIRQQEVGIVESFGRFKRVLQPGLNFIIPVVESVVTRVDLRIRKVESHVGVRTSDNVYVQLPVALMISVVGEKADTSFYKLAGNDQDGGAQGQVATWALNALRAAAAGLSLQDLFTDRDKLQADIKASIEAKLDELGFHLNAILVDQPLVPEEVQHASNDVEASKRLAEAAKQKGEAQRVLAVAEATAEAESQRLRAKGLADARAILAEGLAKSLAEASKNGVQPDALIPMLLELSRLDAIRTAATSGACTILDVRTPPNLAVPAAAHAGEPVAKSSATASSSKEPGAAQFPS